MDELLCRAQTRSGRAVTTATDSHDQGAACLFRISWAQMLALVRVSLSGHQLVPPDHLSQAMAGTQCHPRHKTIEEHHTNHVKGLQRDVQMHTMDRHTPCHDLHRRMRSLCTDQPSMDLLGSCKRRSNSHRHLKQYHLVHSVSQQATMLVVVCMVRDRSLTTLTCLRPRFIRTEHH